jgi:hypothetical protein
MSVPDGLRVLLDAFILWSPDGSFDDQGAGLEDGEAYYDLELAQSIMIEAYRAEHKENLPSRNKRRYEWTQRPGMHRWFLCINYGPPVNAGPQETGWYIDPIRVLGVSDGLCHEVTLAGDCSLGLDHSGSHDWER